MHADEMLHIVTGPPGRVNVQVRILGGVTMVCDCGFTWVDSNVSVQGLEMKRLFKFLNLLNSQFKSFIYILRHYQTCKNVTRYCTEVILNYNTICKCMLG